MKYLETTTSMKFRKYLTKLKDCTDQNTLVNDLKMHDNFFIHLYGNFEELYPKIQQSFRDSPSEEGISERWEQDNEGGTYFSYHGSPGLTTPTAQLGNSFGSLYNHLVPKEINGQDPSMWVCFHAVSDLKRGEDLANADWRTMASAITSFGDYILKEKITSRLPTINLEYASQ